MILARSHRSIASIRSAHDTQQVYPIHEIPNSGESTQPHSLIRYISGKKSAQSRQDDAGCHHGNVDADQKGVATFHAEPISPSRHGRGSSSYS
jgi:hypothetical protein